MLLSAVSILVVVQSSSQIPEGLMNNPVLNGRIFHVFYRPRSFEFAECTKQKTRSFVTIHFYSILMTVYHLWHQSFIGFLYHPLFKNKLSAQPAKPQHCNSTVATLIYTFPPLHHTDDVSTSFSHSPPIGPTTSQLQTFSV